MAVSYTSEGVIYNKMRNSQLWSVTCVLAHIVSYLKNK